MRDLDRPLSSRGMRDAPRVGAHLRGRRTCPDAILSSTATRALRTAEEVATSTTFAGTIEVVPRLYLADPESILDVIRDHGGDASRLLVVGHNPGLEELVARLVPRENPQPLPTAALVEVELDIDSWCDARISSPARVVDRWRPPRRPER